MKKKKTSGTTFSWYDKLLVMLSHKDIVSQSGPWIPHFCFPRHTWFSGTGVLGAQRRQKCDWAHWQVREALHYGELTASTSPFSVGVFSMSASKTSSLSFRTYSKTGRAKEMWSVVVLPTHTDIHTCTISRNWDQSYKGRKKQQTHLQAIKSQHHGQSFMWPGESIWSVMCVLGSSDFAPHILFPSVRNAAQTTRPTPTS